MRRRPRHRLEDKPEMSLRDQALLLARTPIIARRMFPNDETCRLFVVSAESTRLK